MNKDYLKKRLIYPKLNEEMYDIIVATSEEFNHDFNHCYSILTDDGWGFVDEESEVHKIRMYMFAKIKELDENNPNT